MKVYELYSSTDGNYVIAGAFEKDTISGSGRVFQLNEVGADVIKKIKF